MIPLVSCVVDGPSLRAVEVLSLDPKLDGNKLLHQDLSAGLRGRHRPAGGPAKPH